MRKSQGRTFQKAHPWMTWWGWQPPDNGVALTLFYSLRKPSLSLFRAFRSSNAGQVTVAFSAREARKRWQDTAP